MRIYAVKEGDEKDDMILLVTRVIPSSLGLPTDMEMDIRRAHRSLAAKPNGQAPQRSILVRYVDHRLKEKILRTALGSPNSISRGQRIFFDQDYTAEIQKKRKQVQDIIKQLKEKKIRATSQFLAQLRIYMKQGSKTFPTMMDPVASLEGMGIHIKVDEWEDLRNKMLCNAWSNASKNAAGDKTLKAADL